MLLPTNTMASLFLIALATWFPVAMLTWSGVAGVSRGYYDVARTLGAREQLPDLEGGRARRAALGLRRPVHGPGRARLSPCWSPKSWGSRPGLGWYIQWALGWGEWKKAWAALLIMIVLFSGLITLLFRIRNRVLSWQKGLVRW